MSGDADWFSIADNSHILKNYDYIISDVSMWPHANRAYLNRMSSLLLYKAILLPYIVIS